MNRRGFLRMIGEAAAAGLILPDLAKELIAPARTIFLPPTDGWLWSQGPLEITTNSLLTPTMITREALRLLHQKLQFISTINRTYDPVFASNQLVRNMVQVRRP